MCVWGGIAPRSNNSFIAMPCPINVDGLERLSVYEKLSVEKKKTPVADNFTTILPSSNTLSALLRTHAYRGFQGFSYLWDTFMTLSYTK